MGAEERNVDFLKEIVRRIYAAMVRTEYLVYEMFPEIRPTLPQQIHFIHSEDLLQKYPTFTPKRTGKMRLRKEYGAVFIIGIGCKLSNGEKHDGRAPDYDDWSTVAENGQVGLNGDLLVWDEVLNRSLELSSMGIRVDKGSLAPPVGDLQRGRKKRTIFPQTLAKQRTASKYRGRYRTKSLVYVLPPQSPYPVKFRQVYGRKKCVVKPVLPVCT